MNKMSVRPTHDVMPTGHAISGAGLLTPLGVSIISNNLIIDDLIISNNLIIEVYCFDMY